MREEELEKRLQSAFPQIPPPDEALHARIQSLSASKAAKTRRRVTWKRLIGGAALAGFSALALSRLAVGYVLYQMSSARVPSTTYYEARDYTNNEKAVNYHWIADKKERIVGIRNATVSEKSRVLYSIKKGNRIASWFQGKEKQGKLSLSVVAPGVLYHHEGNASQINSTTDWLPLTLRGPWIIRLPDQIVHGRRQWVLQQYHFSLKPDPRIPHSIEHRRMVWGIDVKTRRVSWKEYWSSSQNAAWKLDVRFDYQYDLSMSDTLFEIPANVRLRWNTELRTVTAEPAFNPYFPNLDSHIAVKNWWNDVLVGH